MGLHKLIFDTTDAQSIQDGHSVGSYVRAGKGGALVSYHGYEQTSAVTKTFADTDVTFAADTITLTGHGFFNGDKIRFTTAGTLPAPLAVLTDYWVIYVDANTIKVAASQNNAELGIPIDLTDAGAGSSTAVGQTFDIRALDTWIVNSVDVHATNLDIRDLTAVSDSVQSWLHDGAGTAITSTGGALDVNILTPITVDTKVDGVFSGGNPDPDNVGLITHVRGAAPADADQTFRSTGAAASSDAVVAANVKGMDVNTFGMLYNGTTWDRWKASGAAGSADVNVTNTITTTDAALANTAVANGKTTLATSGTEQNAVTAGALTARKYLWIMNNDNKLGYIGATGVTAANGYPIPPGSEMQMRAGAAVPLKLVGTKTNQDMRTLELS